MPRTAPVIVGPPHTVSSPPTAGYRAAIPNALTIARLAIAVVFFALLSVYRYPDREAWALPVSAVLFIVAALTDALDGWLARRWRVVTVFGRIMDPLADKVLVLGAFILLAGRAFTEGGTQVSAVEPWMVIVILARELLVTTIRAVFESRGIDFSASLSGKVKMIVQSAAAPMILVMVWMLARRPHGDLAGPLRMLIAGAAWTTVVITAFSGVPYVLRAWKQLGWSAMIPPPPPPANP